MSLSSESSNVGHKIIIDTDAGIDDAIALLLALSSKDIADLLAITCCFGNTTLENVFDNVRRVLEVCGEKQIPVYKGSRGPLIKKIYDKYTLDRQYAAENSPHAYDGLGNVGSKYSTGDILESLIPAAVALIDLTRKYPSKITLIAVGPLTNLALAHRIDPDFFTNLKSLVLMGGNYKGIGNISPASEFNFYCDPEAAEMVLSEAKTKITLVPWETCMEYGIPWKLHDELIQISTKKGNFFRDITNYSRTRGIAKGNKQQYDCDFLAVAAFLYPESVTASITSALAVECSGSLTRGLTIHLNTIQPCDRELVTVVTDFDKEKLNQLRFKMLK